MGHLERGTLGGGQRTGPEPGFNASAGLATLPCQMRMRRGDLTPSGSCLKRQQHSSEPREEVAVTAPSRAQAPRRTLLSQLGPHWPDLLTLAQLLQEPHQQQPRRRSSSPIIKTMSKLNSLKDLLIHELKDLHSAESQLVKALPKLAQAASDQALKSAFEQHLGETEEHVTRIEGIMENLGASPNGKSCKAMQGLIAEGEEIIKEEAEPAVKDAALIVAAQKVEHYEIAAYGSARAMAEALGFDDIVGTLDTTLEEEGSTDQSLTALAEDINAAALGSDRGD